MKLGFSNLTISGINTMEGLQVSRSFYLFGARPLSRITALVVAFAAFAIVFHCLGFLSIFLTSSALILCPIAVTFSLKPNSPSPDPDNQIMMPQRDEALSSSTSAERCPSEMEEECAGSNFSGHGSGKKMRDEVGADHNEAAVRSKEGTGVEEGEMGHASQFLLTRNRTKSEQMPDTTDDDGDDDTKLGYEIRWSSRDSSSSTYNQDWWSDGSISDEESLIEIELPTGHYVDSKNIQDVINREYSNYMRQKWQPDCSMVSLLRQQTLMELLSDPMNEEDNLIEIDISMGSIKCPRFEIKT